MVLTAFPVGFFAGLFGIGGGLITVPFLFFIFETLNIDKSYIMHLAVGTSFSIIVPTSLSSVLTHKKNNYVDLNIIKTYIIFVIIGVLAGTIFAALMQTKGLVLFFSIVVYFLGTYLLLSSNKVINSKKKFNLSSRIIAGLTSGFISASMGIGGAIMNVPVLRYFGYPIKKAIGSAAAIGLVIAIVGAIGFLTSGSFLDANLPLSIGFINIPAFLIFIPITTFMARVGANTVHKIDKTKVQAFFGIFLYFVGTIFIYRYVNL
jgi:Predicted permeases